MSDESKTLYRATTLVSVDGVHYGQNQHFRAEPEKVAHLLESGQIEAVDEP